jgi:DNA-binding beta-propeller fold protein YncE
LTRFFANVALLLAALVACAPLPTSTARIPSEPAKQALYVANAHVSYGVSEYAVGKEMPLRVLAADHPCGVQLTMAVDHSGFVYIGYDGCNGNSVSVYPPHGNRPIRVLSKGIATPYGLAVDTHGRLYVANEDPIRGLSSLSVFSQGGASLLRVIIDGIRGPLTPVFDTDGNVFVPNQFGGAEKTGSVTVYNGKNYALTRTITVGIMKPVQLAFDSRDFLYVLNYPPASVSVYAPGASVPKYSITDGLRSEGTFPSAIALDSSDSLYVANDTVGEPRGSITVYSAGSLHVKTTLRDEINSPAAIGIDSFGDLYVANDDDTGLNAGWISVYAPGRSLPKETITENIGVPVGLTFGPE